MRQVVGIDRKIKRAWLDAALDRLAQGTDESELRTFLDNHLKDELPGQASRAKSIGIILRIWSGIPRERLALRDRAIALLPKISGQERVWLHWGMAAVAYPFFRDTAEVVGRLVTLQDDFTTAHVQARMLTNWGDRATCREAAQKLVTMLVDWEVLRATKTKGHFLLARQMTASIPELQLWLLESLLWASTADEIEAQQLLRLPESFPFQFNVGVSDLRKHEGFNIHRQGLDMDMVDIRKVKLEPLPKRAKKKPSKKRKPEPEQPNLFDGQSDETAPRNGKPTDAAPNKARSKKKTETNSDDRRRVEESIKNEVLRTLSERAERFLKVRGTLLVPDGPFAAPSVECAEQFRDGHYFGCIALTQAVLEAVIRHIWKVKLKKKPSQEGSFDKNLAALHKKNFISDEWKEKLELMWAERHSFHHLRPSVESDQQKLEETARNTLLMLNDLEQEFFGFDVNEGVVVPHHPEYWSIKDGESLVFVRGQE